MLFSRPSYTVPTSCCGAGNCPDQQETPLQRQQAHVSSALITAQPTPHVVSSTEPKHLLERCCPTFLHLGLVVHLQHQALSSLLQLQHVHGTAWQAALPAHTHSHAAVMGFQQLANLLPGSHVAALLWLAAAAIKGKRLNSGKPTQFADLQQQMQQQQSIHCATMDTDASLAIWARGAFRERQQEDTLPVLAALHGGMSGVRRWGAVGWNLMSFGAGSLMPRVMTHTCHMHGC